VTVPFDQVLRRHLDRRALLGAGGAATLALLAPSLARAREPGAGAETLREFDPVPASRDDGLLVPPGYEVQVVLAWGDPVLPGAPPFDPHALTFEAQRAQLGTNSDYVALVPHPDAPDDPDRGLLCVSHEYTEPELMWAGASSDPHRLDRAQALVDMAAHGLSVAEVRRLRSGAWRPSAPGPLNRRVTPFTPALLTGPAAGHPLLRTSADATGRVVLGTIGNCAGGITPWGTWLQAEENFDEYFGGTPPDEDEPGRLARARYGDSPRSLRGWERHDPRFDRSKEPNEEHRFGWVVEVDPARPLEPPKKRTALGRFKHEAANVALARSGQVAVYMGDDEAFEFLYKFVSRERVDPSRGARNGDLLDAGTLHVARFEEDGSGRWLPLRFGEGRLRPEHGFADEGEVLIRARLAGTAVGGTPMDRPEDVEVDAETGRVFLALTNNKSRKAGEETAPNPRAPNRHGHLIEIQEEGDDAAATTFRWGVLLLGGPADEGGTARGDVLSCPDNLAMGPGGRLWVATDGQPGTLDANDAVFAVDVRGSERGRARRFLSAVPGAEVCGPAFDRSRRTFFCAIQHPAAGIRGSTFETPATRFPGTHSVPRSCVIAVYRADGGGIGA